MSEWVEYGVKVDEVDFQSGWWMVSEWMMEGV